jgi:hypothetical protein
MLDDWLNGEMKRRLSKAPNFLDKIKNSHQTSWREQVKHECADRDWVGSLISA